MSALALSSRLAEAKSRDSPSRGWRSGSRVTSGQTSARSFPVKFITSLCQRVGKAPLGQFRAWLMEKAPPHSHLAGSFSGSHPYLKHKASRNAPLGSTNPWQPIRFESTAQVNVGTNQTSEGSLELRASSALMIR